MRAEKGDSLQHMRADWYDFPGWYDILHAPGTAREIDGLERIEQRFSSAKSKRAWLEPACGSGRYLRVAAARGVRAIGFDRSEKMIDYARATFRKKRLRAELFVGDMTRFTITRPATLAFCPINTIRHLPSNEALLAHLRCVRRALVPGGIYVVGIETCRYGLEFPSEDVWVGKRGRTTVRQTVQYLPPTRRTRIERVISHLEIDTHAGSLCLDSTYDLRAYSARQWEDCLTRARWRVLGVCDADGHDALRGPRGAIVGGYGLHVLSPA